MGSLYFGKKSQVFEKLTSTNAKAKELLANESLPEGTLIRTINQYAGRGYAKNVWESEPEKNITCSYILLPDFLKPDRQFWITKVLSLAVMEFVKELLPASKTVTIKWPNDIYVGNKKIAGILVENSIMADTIRHSIAGIGINVNQEKFLSDAPNPTSLRLESKRDFDLIECYNLLSAKLEYWYNLLRMGDNGQIDDNYTRNLFRCNQAAWYMADGNKFSAIITGTDNYGRLILEKADGSVGQYDFKEIIFLLD